VSADDRRYRHLVTFGTGDGEPCEGVARAFVQHAEVLTAAVPAALRAAFVSLDHDFSNGSDHVFLLEGLITQAAAEIWASERIRSGKLATLTIFHHARALYEAHALAYWLTEDVDGRWRRLMKDHIRERQRFEVEASSSIGQIETDITAFGHALLADDSVKLPPSMFDMVKNHPVLRYDLAFFWKHSSAHVHPGSISVAAIDARSERTMIEQILAGCVRHAAGTYRQIIDRYAITDAKVVDPLREAEAWASYRFPIPNQESSGTASDS
jgi:hypothetical protein